MQYKLALLPPSKYTKTLLLLQSAQWRCVDCVIHHERDVREEQRYICVVRTSNNRVISSGDLYCCLLPRCEALRTCRSGFPIATKWCCHQDVEVVLISAFPQKNVRSVWFGRCVDCVIHHKRDVREETKYISLLVVRRFDDDAAQRVSWCRRMWLLSPKVKAQTRPNTYRRMLG